MEWKFRFLHDVLGISRQGGPARPGTLAVRDPAAREWTRPVAVPRAERAGSPADPAHFRHEPPRD